MGIRKGLLVALEIVGIAFGSYFVNSMINKFLGSQSSNYILLVTAIIIIIYTIETYRLRKEAQITTDLTREERELSLLPLISLTYDQPGITDPRGFRLVNIGHGAALNVEIETATVARNGDETISCIIRPKLQVIPAGEESEVDIASYLNGQSDGANSACLYLSSDHGTNINLKITFRNSIGARYRMKLSKTASGYRVTTPPVRLR